MKKIIFCDIDGTILDSVRNMPKVSEYTKYAFEELRKNHIVFLASGRSKCMLDEDILSLNPHGFICANGAYAEYEGTILFEDGIDCEKLQKVKSYCNKRDFCYYFETQDRIYIDDLKNPLHKAFEATWILPDCYSDEPMPEDATIHIAMIACHNEEECEEVKEYLKNDFDVRRQNGFTSFDLNPYGINKGYATEKVLNALHMTSEDAYAFGDGLNDIEMFEKVKYSVAMGNAFDEVKKVAYLQTEDVLEDGFYRALVREGLIQEKV